jgi:hypothetical protein
MVPHCIKGCSGVDKTGYESRASDREFFQFSYAKHQQAGPARRIDDSGDGKQRAACFHIAETRWLPAGEARLQPSRLLSHMVKTR